MGSSRNDDTTHHSLSASVATITITITTTANANAGNHQVNVPSKNNNNDIETGGASAERERENRRGKMTGNASLEWTPTGDKMEMPSEWTSDPFFGEAIFDDSPGNSPGNNDANNDDNNDDNINAEADTKSNATVTATATATANAREAFDRKPSKRTSGSNHSSTFEVLEEDHKKSRSGHPSRSVERQNSGSRQRRGSGAKRSKSGGRRKHRKGHSRDSRHATGNSNHSLTDQSLRQSAHSHNHSTANESSFASFGFDDLSFADTNDHSNSNSNSNDDGVATKPHRQSKQPKRHSAQSYRAASRNDASSNADDDAAFEIDFGVMDAADGSPNDAGNASDSSHSEDLIVDAGFENSLQDDIFDATHPENEHRDNNDNSNNSNNNSNTKKGIDAAADDDYDDDGGQAGIQVNFLEGGAVSISHLDGSGCLSLDFMTDESTHSTNRSKRPGRKHRDAASNNASAPTTPDKHKHKHHDRSHDRGTKTKPRSQRRLNASFTDRTPKSKDDATTSAPRDSDNNNNSNNNHDKTRSRTSTKEKSKEKTKEKHQTQAKSPTRSQPRASHDDDKKPTDSAKPRSSRHLSSRQKRPSASGRPSSRRHLTSSDSDTLKPAADSLRTNGSSRKSSSKSPDDRKQKRRSSRSRSRRRKGRSPPKQARSRSNSQKRTHNRRQQRGRSVDPDTQAASPQPAAPQRKGHRKPRQRRSCSVDAQTMAGAGDSTPKMRRKTKLGSGPNDTTAAGAATNSASKHRRQSSRALRKSTSSVSSTNVNRTDASNDGEDLTVESEHFSTRDAPSRRSSSQAPSSTRSLGVDYQSPFIEDLLKDAKEATAAAATTPNSSKENSPRDVAESNSTRNEGRSIKFGSRRGLLVRTLSSGALNFIKPEYKQQQSTDDEGERPMRRAGRNPRNRGTSTGISGSTTAEASRNFTFGLDKSIFNRRVAPNAASKDGSGAFSKTSQDDVNTPRFDGSSMRRQRGITRAQSTREVTRAMTREMAAAGQQIAERMGTLFDGLRIPGPNSNLGSGNQFANATNRSLESMKLDQLAPTMKSLFNNMNPQPAPDFQPFADDGNHEDDDLFD